jgi:hypothetical protein
MTHHGEETAVSLHMLAARSTYLRKQRTDLTGAIPCLRSARPNSQLTLTKINSNGETTLELDSHADTCVLGHDALFFLDYDRPVVVEGYDPALGTKTYATAGGGLAYDDPQTSKVYHLVMNQAIYIPHLDQHLLCPVQCQVNDKTILDNTPNFFVHNPTDHTHAPTIKDPDNPAQMVILPLALQGVTFVT